MIDKPLLCPNCNTPSLEALEPNSYSRKPGFRCKDCGESLRAPESGKIYVGILLLGVLFVALGVYMLASWQGNPFALIGLGVAGAGFAIRQLLLPAAKLADDEPS
ncbi:MAG: hypothetical protein AAF483_31080 [Planctomycetota bacterium]